MDRTQKILMIALWSLTVLAVLGVVGTALWARRQAANIQPLESPPMRYQAPSFELTDQNGRTFSSSDLKQDVWVAMVFFAQCPGVCPMMTQRLAEVQKAIGSPRVKIVSFSLDPEHDTPEALKLYAERFGADQSRWYFLTGPQATMYEIANGLKLAAKPAENGNPIIHTQKVLLVARGNQVRGVYDTNDDEQMKGLAKDAQTLAAEKAP